jgi:hypothetical protein
MEKRMTRSLIGLMFASTLGWSCGGDPETPLAPVVATSIPDCYRMALETCSPQGACLAEAALGANGDNGDVWVCFANGVRMHTTKHTQAGVVTTTKSVEKSGALCRTIESMEGPAGATFTVKNSQGDEVASVRFTAFPGMTLSCGGRDYQLDRETETARTALSMMAPELALASSCTAGACKAP